MIAVDTNLLVYAHRRDSPFHDAALGVVRRLAESPSPWAIPWPCIHEFYAIVTHPRIYDPPSPSAAAIVQIENWLASPSLILLAEGTGHWDLLKSLVTGGRIAGPQVHDARVAALCLAYGARLWSVDRDFGRFPRLDVTNPLTH